MTLATYLDCTTPDTVLLKGGMWTICSLTSYWALTKNVGLKNWLSYLEDIKLLQSFGIIFKLCKFNLTKTIAKQSSMVPTHLFSWDRTFV